MKKSQFVLLLKKWGTLSVEKTGKQMEKSVQNTSNHSLYNALKYFLSWNCTLAKQYEIAQLKTRMLSYLKKMLV